MKSLPKSYTDATIIDGLTALYAKNPETAHTTLCANTVQISVNLHTTIQEACVSGYFPHTLPKEKRHVRTVVNQRKKVKKFLKIIDSTSKVLSVTENDLWFLHLHLNFDFTECGSRDARFNEEELTRNREVRSQLDLATLKSFRLMVHNLQTSTSGFMAPVLPTFQQTWRQDEHFEEFPWDEPLDPYNLFLVRYQLQPKFHAYYQHFFQRRLKTFESDERKEKHRAFIKKQKAQDDTPRRSHDSMTLNPYNLKPFHPKPR